jgi:hypothetical protein
MKFLKFFLSWGGNLACLDPDLDSQSGSGSADPIESGSETLDNKKYNCDIIKKTVLKI